MRQYLDLLRAAGLATEEGWGSDRVVRAVLCGALFPNVAAYDAELGRWCDAHGTDRLQIAPESLAAGREGSRALFSYFFFKFYFSGLNFTMLKKKKRGKDSLMQKPRWR